jgi:hypothetical protein
MKKVSAVKVVRRKGAAGQLLGRLLFPLGVWVTLILASGRRVHKRIGVDQWFTPTFGVRNVFFRYDYTGLFFTMYRGRGFINRKGVEQ